MRSLLRLRPAAWACADVRTRASPLEVCRPRLLVSASPVSAKLVKELRDRTGASMGKCREALAAEGGEIEQAVEWLRRKGVRSMEKRATEPGEALLALSVGPGAGAFVELRSETDFVARTELFQQLAMSIANTVAREAAAGKSERDAILGRIDVDGAALKERVGDAYDSVEAALLDVGSVLGERLALGAVDSLCAPAGGVVAGYVHRKSADGLPGLGRMAGLLALQPQPAAGFDEVSLSRVAGQLVRHVVAAQPEFLSVESIPAERLNKELAVLKAAHLEQLGPAKAAKVDEKVLSKVLEGKTRKFHQDTVLLSQELIAPGSPGADASAKPKRVEEWLLEEAKALGLEALIVREYRLKCL